MLDEKLGRSDGLRSVARRPAHHFYDHGLFAAHRAVQLRGRDRGPALRSCQAVVEAGGPVWLAAAARRGLHPMKRRNQLRRVVARHPCSYASSSVVGWLRPRVSVATHCQDVSRDQHVA